MGTTSRKNIRTALILLLFVGLFHGTLSSAASQLDDRSALSSTVGGSDFWKDPCTWDGISVGVGLSFCVTGRATGCAAAFYGILRAIKTDNCF